MAEIVGCVEGTEGPASSRHTLTQDVFMGHDFCGSVLNIGPGTAGPAAGSLVTSLPTIITPTVSAA